MEIRKGKGFGYLRDDKTNFVCMIRCFECGRENYSSTVSSGFCAWCNYDANGENKNPSGSQRGLKNFKNKSID